MRFYAAALLLALTACTGGAKPKASPTETVPMIATDACPASDALLATPAPDGDRLPDVDLPCIGHDGSVNMRALGRIPYVVNLWGSWCFPCRTEMPEFQKVYAAYKGRVGFVGVDTKDFDKPARAAIQRAAISYPSVFDPDEKVKRSLNARSLPTTVLVGVDGRIKDVHVGELTAEELRANIAKHLGIAPMASRTEPVPMIATDACPSGGALLSTPAPDGDRLPDVDLPCIGHDGSVNMRALGGVPYVVNLWGSWCPPCRAEMPELQQVYASLKGRVGFLGVDTLDFDKPARAAIQRAAISYPNVFDKDSKVRLALGARTLPATVLVGADGRIEDVHVGQLTAAELRANIAKHLGIS